MIRRANAIALPPLEPVRWVGNGNYYSCEAKAHLPFNFALRCWSQSKGSSSVLAKEVHGGERN